MKYTGDAVQMAPFGDWDTFFADAKKVRLQLVLVIFEFSHLLKQNRKRFCEITVLTFVCSKIQVP